MRVPTQAIVHALHDAGHGVSPGAQMPPVALHVDDRLARDPDSLLAKTLDLKDHVVAATKQAVAALGDMFASVGEHIGGSTPAARQFNTDS